MSIPAPLQQALGRLERVSQGLAAPILEGRRARNQASWVDAENWVFGFYFGYGDTRLWVPRKMKGGEPSEDRCLINFGHPLGRKAFRILALAYIAGATFFGFLTAVLLGYR